MLKVVYEPVCRLLSLALTPFPLVVPLHMTDSTRLDEIVYDACSLSSVNDTEDGIVGSGRTLGKAYARFGHELEAILNRFVVWLGHGPNVIAIRIQKFQDNQAPDLARRKKLEKNCKRPVRYAWQVLLIQRC